MWSGKKKWFLLLPLVVLAYVPITIQGFDSVFWIFSLNLNALGEKGVIWHCYALLRYMHWGYVLLELIIAYAALFSVVYCIHWMRGDRRQQRP